MPDMTPPLPASADLATTWNYIENGIDKILVQDISYEGISTRMYMNVYTAIHNFCVAQNSIAVSAVSTSRISGAARGAQLLGKDLYQNLEKYLTNHLTTLQEQAMAFSDESLIQYYIRCWDRYTLGARYLNHIFDYLNRHWVKREREEGRRNIHDVYTLCLVTWKSSMFNQVQEKLVTAVLKQIEKQRNGEIIHTNSIKTVIQSFVALGLDESNTKKTNLSVYQEYFENKFVQATGAYYMQESEEFLATNGIVIYMKKAESRLAQEAANLVIYLHQSTEKKLTDKLDEVLISAHAQAMHQEFETLLRNDRHEDFHRMYLLLSRIPKGLEPIQEIFKDYISKQGFAAIDKLVGELGGAKVDPKVYVETLLKVNVKYTLIVKEDFENNTEMVKSLDNGCRDYINNNAIARPPAAAGRDSKTPELLARYADTMLKKSSKGIDEADIETRINYILRIFQFVDEKDVFQKFYSRLLSKRLVFGSSASQDAEENVVTKLKEACGYEYTNKLQRMFQDMATSSEMQAEFKGTLSKSDTDFSAYVLAEGFWPFPSHKVNFNLPHSLKGTFDKFHGFYQSKHSGRKLFWLWNFAKGDLKANFSKSSKAGFTFQVSAYQMAILLPYNEADSYTYKELSEITGLDDEPLAGSLSILVKARVLLENPQHSEERTPEPDTTYTLNLDFKSKRIRVNLNLPLRFEQKQETEETQKKIEEDRKLFLQATIVRIMKARKELGHAQLLQETIDQSRKRFNPKVPEIKKSIDELIDREYLERVDGNKYVYLA